MQSKFNGEMIEAGFFLSPRVPFRKIGDGQVQQLNVHDYYDLGKKVEETVRTFGDANAPLAMNSAAWTLFVLRWQFSSMLKEPCALLPASQRAAQNVIKTIDNIVSSDIQEIFKIDKDELLQPWQMGQVKSAIDDFETILKNDMPEMSTFAVSQIGIYRTDDLIRNSYRQIAEPVRSLLLDKAKNDLIESGKCLAFRLSTACAFHVCRAIEAGIDQYYEALTGKPYEVSPNGGNNNWGAKTDALVKSGASVKVTEFLVHIRKQYRNPVTHPEEVLDEHEAAALFTASLSAISMMLGEVKTLNDKKQPSLPLTALAEGYESAMLGTGDVVTE